MRLYQRFALLSVIVTYFLIFVGGLVRVSGAGLGCPDWPKCFGRWIPPTNINQLPAEFAPETFNFTLAWIEYINRLVGVLVGFAILVTAILAIVYYRKHLSVLIPSMLAAILVAYQGWQGSQVVASELEPIIVSVHMVLAFVIISLLIYAAFNSFYISGAVEEKADYPAKSSALIAGLWGVTILQVLLGTQVRGAIEHAIRDYPLLFGSELLAKVGFIDELHMGLGIVLAIGLIVFSWSVLKTNGISQTVRLTTWSVILIAALQIILGHILLFIGLPEIVQLLHLWLSSLLIGALLVLFVSIRQSRRVKNV
jgi:cytochrome c oxidase assembly protein subunit 15